MNPDRKPNDWVASADIGGERERERERVRGGETGEAGRTLGFLDLRATMGGLGGARSVARGGDGGGVRVTMGLGVSSSEISCNRKEKTRCWCGGGTGLSGEMTIGDGVRGGGVRRVVRTLNSGEEIEVALRGDVSVVRVDWDGAGRGLLERRDKRLLAAALASAARITSTSSTVRVASSSTEGLVIMQIAAPICTCHLAVSSWCRRRAAICASVKGASAGRSRTRHCDRLISAVYRNRKSMPSSKLAGELSGSKLHRALYCCPLGSTRKVTQTSCCVGNLPPPA